MMFSKNVPRTRRPSDLRFEALSQQLAQAERRLRDLEAASTPSGHRRTNHPDVAALLDEARAEILALERAANDVGATGFHPHPIRSQHRWLARTADRLGSLLKTITAQVEVVETDRDATLLMLRCFTHELRAHFEFEEEGGHLAPALSIAPRFGRRARALREQHAQFTERIERVFAEATEAGDSVDRWRRAFAAFGRFRADLLAHETAENEIMQRAHNEDVGSGD
jgi:hypothetical protein